MSYKKQYNAERAKQEKIAKECTFAPKTNKKRIISTADKSKADITRSSIGSINLEGIAKKKSDEEPFGAEKKYDRLYNLRKRQVDKTDKAKEDYEFERMGQECTFAPKLMTKNQHVAPRALNNASSINSFRQEPNMTAEQRRQKNEQKQLDRMQKAREEKQRKAAMFERGIPQSKPLSSAQIAEQEATRLMILEKKN